MTLPHTRTILPYSKVKGMEVTEGVESRLALVEGSTRT